jgi:hypothetical protein
MQNVLALFCAIGLIVGRVSFNFDLLLRGIFNDNRIADNVIENVLLFLPERSEDITIRVIATKICSKALVSSERSSWFPSKKAFFSRMFLVRSKTSSSRSRLLFVQSIGNKPSGGGDISIEEMWFRMDSIDDPEENAIPMLVP